MPERSLSNPRGAFRTVTTFVQCKDADGNLIEYPQEYCEFESNAAIAYGAPVIFVIPTTTTPLRVTAAGAAAVGLTIKGINQSRGITAAGQVCQIVNYGFCEVVVQEAPTAAAAFGTSGMPSTEAGKVNSASPVVDATLIVGTILGTFLAAQHDETADLAPFWFEHL